MFITFDGPEGTGKTTQANMVGLELIQRGYQVVYIREPGGTDFGEDIRKLIHKHNGTLNARTELLLFNTARAHLIDQIIIPSLADGKIVICDRFVDSSFAYQGTAGVPLEDVRTICDFATGGICPDMTFLFSLHPDEAEKRDQQLLTVRPENAWKQFNMYRDLIAQDPQRWRVISGYLSVEAITQEVLRHIEQHPKFAQLQPEGV